MKRVPQARLRLAVILLATFATAASSLAAGEKKDAKSEAKSQVPACEAAAQMAIIATPIKPWSGAPLAIMVAATDPAEAEVSLIAPDGSTASTSKDRQGGPPYAWFVETSAPAAGTWKVQIKRPSASTDCQTITREISVEKQQPAKLQPAKSGVWPLRDTWNASTENAYSAWIEKLFDAPLSESPSWPALHDVLRDKSRNVLFNHLGHGEDEKKITIKPDCADLPYFLRAYFAFKMGLPFGYAKCSRGGGGKAPQCPAWVHIFKEDEPEEKSVAKDESILGQLFGADTAKAKAQAKKAENQSQGLVSRFGRYLNSAVANTVHSGSGRTAADDNVTDYYPVPLSQDALRPGTVYADPYGHLLVLVKRVPQTTTSAGVFLAVDGQPDGTVARKRFWRGNFLFAQNPALGGPGFKRFRPIVRDKSAGLRRLKNAEITKVADYADFSLDQSKMDVEAFYDRMDDVMSPEPLDPLAAIKDAITSLDEQVKARVTSVENGRKYQTGGGAEVAMPAGASIFETTGAWEDFATPSRDLRLLIAIDVVTQFPDRVARRPERYAMPKDKTPADVKIELQSVLASELAQRKFDYLRTDGSPWTLALKDVVDRAGVLEMAYNINDCPELRWGAEDKSDEAAKCKRRAPATQRKKMSEYRAWFKERRRPPRG